MTQNRRTIHPYIIDEGNSHTLLRVPFVFSKEQREQSGSQHFDENWVQELVKNNPDILPINQIEPLFAPAISIGRETPTKVGFIDNLLISPEGYITIVETKLWRNVEARREVVGQIIDYAQALSHWSYSDLDEAVKAYTASRHHEDSVKNLFELVSSSESMSTDEQDFIDTVSQNLSAGRFLLLIVGDGIREEVEELSNFLNDKTNLHFTLGMVELQTYQMPNSENRLVLPQLVAQTREIVRHVIRTQDGSLTISQTDNTNTSTNSPNAQKSPITSEQFYKEIEANKGAASSAAVKELFTKLENLGCKIEWAKATGSARMRSEIDPNISYNIISVERGGYIYVGYLSTPFSKTKIPKEIYQAYAADTAALFKKEVSDKYSDAWKGYADTALLPEKMEEFLTLAQGLMNDIGNAEARILSEN